VSIVKHFKNQRIMKTHQPNLMFGNKVARSISKGLKGIALMACVFTYTGSFAQSNVSFTAPVNPTDVQRGTIDIAIKVENRGTKNYTPSTFAVNVDGVTYSTPIKSVLKEGEYMLISLDASSFKNVSLNNSTNNGINTGGNIGGSKLTLIGNLKEITIDNVSGVMQDDDPGSASILVVDLKTITETGDDSGMGSSFAVRPNENATKNNGNGRADDIITKDEVQGFVKAFPNPARGSFKINTTHSKLIIQEVTVISAIGSKITTIQPSETDAHIVQVDTNNIPAGIYFVAVKTNMGEAVKRIVLVD
jgi:Secretion system C-terminal sorting domain